MLVDCNKSGHPQYHSGHQPSTAAALPRPLILFTSVPRLAIIGIVEIIARPAVAHPPTGQQPKSRVMAKMTSGIVAADSGNHPTGRRLSRAEPPFRVTGPSFPRIEFVGRGGKRTKFLRKLSRFALPRAYWNVLIMFSG